MVVQAGLAGIVGIDTHNHVDSHSHTHTWLHAHANVHTLSHSDAVGPEGILCLFPPWESHYPNPKLVAKL